MKYLNGKDIFPETLLRQIQKYVSGKAVYIPAREEKKEWGETSGYKRYIIERNREIKARFKAGEPLEALADAYFLSLESIKKIVYSKKEGILLDYKCSLSSAREFAAAGKLEEWVHAYLLSDGHNKAFSDGLKLFDRRFLGPIRMPLSLFRRCCGPEEEMTYRVDGGWFEHHVVELMEVISAKADMPPLIVHYVEGDFELNDGNHRFEAYRRLGISDYYVIVWITEQQEYEEFVEKYGAYLDQADQ